MLRLYVTDATTQVQGVYAVNDTTWSETAINYSNAPAITGSPIATSTPAALNAYVDITLPTNAVVPGNLLTFGLKGTGTNSLIVNSRDAATNRPQLVINGGGTPPPTAPVGAFSAAPSSGTAPLTVTFTDQSTNSPTGSAWNFGDPGSGAQNTSTVQNPTHTFASAGNYKRDAHTQQRRGARDSGDPHDQRDAAGRRRWGQRPGGARDIADCTRTTDESTAAAPGQHRRHRVHRRRQRVRGRHAAEYTNCYGPTWGRHKAVRGPAVGNRDYATPGAAGYFDYFGGGRRRARARATTASTSAPGTSSR